MAIDVGAAASDRAGTTVSAWTYVSKENPANETGIITEVKIYTETELTGVEVAAFTASGDNMTTRGYTSLANAAIGLNTYTAPTDFTPFEIRAGDYLGIYITGGTIELDPTGAGYWYYNGDKIPCSAEAFTSVPDKAISLYATGVQLGQINIGDVWKDIQNIQINIGDSWKQLCDMEINIGDVWKKGVY